MADRIAQNTNTGGSTLTYWGSTSRSAQRFVVPSGYTKIAYFKAYLRKVGTPGTLYAALYTNSSGAPGSSLTERGTAESALSSTASWQTLDIADTTVTPGSTYWMVTRQPSSTGTSDGYAWDTATDGTGGRYSTNSGSTWNELPGYTSDWSYEVYAYGPPGSMGSTTLGTPAETTVTASSSVGNDYGATVTERGFVYSTSNSTPTISDTKKVVGSGEGSFNTTITGLTGGTLYYIRSYATNAAGTGYGAATSFTTDANVPEVVTNAVTSIGNFTATYSGEVVDAHGAAVTARGFCWSTSTGPTTGDDTQASGTGVGVFTEDITGLSANTTYYVRAYATNSEGTAYGGEASFTTSAAAPTVTTGSVTSLLDVTATLGANVTSAGGGTISQRGVVYATSTNPTTSNNKLTSAGTTGSFTVNATGLTPATTYYYRGYAINEYGTSYGSNETFTTEPTEPNTLTATATGKTAVSLTWTKGTGADTTIIRRATGGYPATVTDGTGIYSGSGSSTTDSSLSASTTYYYRAWSRDGASNDSTDYASTTATTDYSFTNAGNVYADDSTYASAPANSDDIYIELSSDNGSTWTPYLSGTLPASNGEVTFGAGSTELWSRSWVGSDLDDGSFAVRITVGSDKNSYQEFNTFGFAVGATNILTGIEVVTKGYFDTDTAYIDLLKVKVYYGTSVIPIGAGTQAYDTTNSTIAFYDGANWNQLTTHDPVTVSDTSEIDLTLSGQEISGSIVAGSIDETKLDTSVNASLDLADSALQPSDNASTCSFRVYRNTNQTVSSATNTKVQYNAESFDEGSDFDSTTNYRFVAPVGGIYQFNATAGFVNMASNDRALVALHVNGTAQSTGGDVKTGGSGRIQVVVSDILKLSSSDYVEVYTYHDGATDEDLDGSGDTRNFFSGALLART